MIPQSTQQVIRQSDFYLEADYFYVVQALRVGTPHLHRLLCHDEKETTVVCTAATQQPGCCSVAAAGVSSAKRLQSGLIVVSVIAGQAAKYLAFGR